MKPLQRGSWLIGTLAAVLIVLVLVILWLYYRTPQKGGQKPLVSRIQESRQAAHSLECRNNLAQIRQALQIRQIDSEENLPATLRELQLPPEMLICPVSKRPYSYDASTGTVRCPAPEHEGY